MLREKMMLIVSLNSVLSISAPTRHCSSPTGSLDGRIVVEEDGEEAADMTTLTWQIGLGETLCYRFKSETSNLAGMVEVTYMSLKTIYSIMDSYKFPLVSSSVSCLCDCPGGASQCDSHTNLCGNNTQCVPYYNPSVQSQGCFLHFLHLSATICCKIQVGRLVFFFVPFLSFFLPFNFYSYTTKHPLNASLKDMMIAP